MLRRHSTCGLTLGLYKGASTSSFQYYNAAWEAPLAFWAETLQNSVSDGQLTELSCLHSLVGDLFGKKQPIIEWDFWNFWWPNKHTPAIDKVSFHTSTWILPNWLHMVTSEKTWITTSLPGPQGASRVKIIRRRGTSKVPLVVCLLYIDVFNASISTQ